MNNRFEIAENVAKRIKQLEAMKPKGNTRPTLRIADVCNDLSIFDWWNEKLSLTQLKEMASFLKTAEMLGFNGYVCFKVGAAGCAHGMWAHAKESENGYSPDGACLYHSFRSGDNYWDCLLPDGEWMHQKQPSKYEFKLSEVKAELARF